MLDLDWTQRAIAGVKRQLPDSKKIEWDTQAGKLLFKYARAAYHVSIMRLCYTAAVQAQTREMASVPMKDGVSTYVGPSAQVLFFNLDAFFEAARSTHEFLLPCLSSAEVLKTRPSSLKTYCQDHSHEEYPQINAVLGEFWEVCGRRTQGYRDCFVHCVSLSGVVWQTALNMRWQDGSWQASLYLPDNPRAKSYGNFTFDDRTDALATCENILEQSVGVIKKTIEGCMEKWRSALDDSEYTIRNIVLGP